MVHTDPAIGMATGEEHSVCKQESQRRRPVDQDCVDASIECCLKPQDSCEIESEVNAINKTTVNNAALPEVATPSQVEPNITPNSHVPQGAQVCFFFN